MNLISRVFILSLCVFTVYAIPNLGNLHELQGKLIHTLAANNTGNSTSNSTENNCSIILPPGNSTGGNSTSNSTECPIPLPPGNGTSNGTGSGNSTENNCIELYTIEMDQINEATAFKSQQCYENGDNMMASMNATMNSTVASVSKQARQIQHRLDMCSGQPTNELMFNCFTHTFDKNLESLNSITVQSQVASAALSGYAYEVQINTQACVGQVLVGSKTNSTIASNNLQVCLQNGSNTSNNGTHFGPGQGNHFGGGANN